MAEETSALQACPQHQMPFFTHIAILRHFECELPRFSIAIIVILINEGTRRFVWRMLLHSVLPLERLHATEGEVLVIGDYAACMP